jgi:hypothetical protein
MARRSHQALVTAAAGACLTLCACGASPAPSAAGSAAATAKATGAAGSATLTGHFCGDASSFMRHIPAAPATKDASTAQAKANLRKVLRSTVKGYTGLENEAPAKLRKPLKTIVAVYKRDEKVLRRSGNLAKISQSMAQGNATGSIAFERVLKYVSVHCK